MKNYYLILTFFAILCIPDKGYSQTTETNHSGYYENNRYPLLTKPYMELPIGSIHPEGWLKEQMERMVTGLTGNLDSIYEHVMGSRNGWLGGDGDVWERGPYWIDGLLPLAYVLDNQELKDKVQPWIEWALASQKPTGYFGPDKDLPYEAGLQRDNAQDWWPKMVVLKVMQQYYSATQDERVIPFLTNYFRYQLNELPKTPLGHWTFWGQQRGGDNLLVVYWLYNITSEPFLLELAELIHEQTLDWTDIFLHQNHLSRPLSLHCVNLAQGFKEPVIYYQQNKDPKQLQAVKKAVSDMRHTIAFPTGLWGGDELLRFGDPTLGSELCTAAEMMYSLEKILEITGDVQWADHLERVTYNALPTQLKEDFSTRQYYQQVNQVRVTCEPRNFVTPHHDTDNLFGELTGYPCCTSNLHQGWPKFTQNLWYATADRGIAPLVYAPSQVEAKVGNGVSVKVKEETGYPFEEEIRFTITFPEKKVKSCHFPFHIRIPAWCQKALLEVNGKALETNTPAGEIIPLYREWKDGDVLTVKLPMEIEITHWYEQAAVVERGPLIYALKMKEKWEQKYDDRQDTEHYGQMYYEVTSDSPWNYCLRWDGIRKETLKEKFIVEKKGSVASYPWTTEEAPVIIRTKATRLPGWEIYRGSAGPIPYFTQNYIPLGEEEMIELIPYGCTTLRITEFPIR